MQSQEKYPTRPIEFIVPFGSGGGTDLTIRIMAAYLTRIWGVPVHVVNKPGGNTIPACLLEVYVANADGYTLLCDGLPSSSMLGAAVKNFPFKIMDRTFIASMSSFALVFMVPPASPMKSLKDLEAEAKRNTETFTWTSLGGASQQDFGTRQFFKTINVNVQKTKPVFAQSGSQAMSLTAEGHVIMGISATPSALPGIKRGNVKPLAVTSKERFPDLPDVPTTAELGYPTVDVIQWNGPSGPPNLPSYVVNTWNKALQEMVRDPEVIAEFRKIGASPFYLGAHEIREYVTKEIEKVEKLWGEK